MGTSNAIPPPRRGNPLVKILLSAAVLGLGIYVTQQRTKSAKSGVPAVAPFRSSAPSSEGETSFAWIPRYPGAALTNIRSRQTAAVLSYGFEFQTADAPAGVAAFFDQGLRAAGFSVMTRNPSGVETDLHGERSDRKRLIDVGIDKTSFGAVVSVLATEQ